tara:strand:+ start:4609 stop:5763 length:1155 start_codon:yes stop_codon:yes gene_type:complete
MIQIQNNQKYFITCPRGLEKITAQNISRFCQQIKINNGGVSFTGDLKSLYNINLNSRTGMFVLLELYKFRSNDINELYSKIYNYSWGKIILPSDTFSIKVNSRSNNFRNSNYLTLKIKDAIVDRIRKDKGNRPNISKNEPNYSIVVVNYQNDFRIYLNSSGVSLNKRGYRNKIHKASLNESLAAGLIMLTGWDGEQALYDPMCGSGTIPLEAALIGFNIPPGIFRKKFAFQIWNNYDETLWYSVLKNAKDRIKKSKIDIFGYDILQTNISLAKVSAERISLHKNIEFHQLDLCSFSPQKKQGIIITNPPYGFRVGDISKLKELYKQIGTTLKNQCCNMDAYIFSGNKELAKEIGLRSSKKIILKNGDIECRFLHFPIKSGKYVE